MSFDQYLEGFGSVVRANLPIAVGGVVTFFVLLYLLVQHRRRRALFDPTVLASAAVAPSLNAKALSWVPPEQSYADRRGSVRREGAPVQVILSSPSFRNGVNDGYVVDRSTGGLRIVMQAAIAPGSTLQIRAVNAPDTIGFVTLIVRSCRKTEDHFVIGGEFEKTPPWNVLLLFG